MGTLLQNTLWWEENGRGLQGHTCSLDRACWGREPEEPQEERGTFQETALVQRETVLASRDRWGIRPGQTACWETGLELQGQERQDLQWGVSLDHLGQHRAMQGQLGMPQAKKEQQGHQEQKGVHQAMQGSLRARQEQLGQQGHWGSLRARQGQLGQQGPHRAKRTQRVLTACYVLFLMPDWGHHPLSHQLTIVET